MKKILYFFALSSALVFNLSLANAEESSPSALEERENTANEERAGEELWQMLQANEISCDELFDEDFDALGEYFMGLMTGDAHPVMNIMMSAMMGEEAKDAMHVAMGKRASQCEPGAAYPLNAWRGTPFSSMMQLMVGGRGGGLWRGMTNFGFYNLGFAGMILMVLWWVFVLALVVLLVRWIAGTIQGKKGGALDILNERFAKGEITKEQYEQMKKDLAS